jgi:PAS domain S-box-containing protein
MAKKMVTKTTYDTERSEESQPTTILLVEDEPAHVEAIRRALELSYKRYNLRVVGTLGDYNKAISEHVPDIAVMDIKLPDGRATDVLTFPPEAAAFPMVIMTSYGNEEIAVEAIKAGALDYIVKSQEAFSSMQRIVERTLREWNHLLERKQNEERYQTLFNNAPAMIITVDHPTSTILDGNNLFFQRTGFERKEVIGKTVVQQFYPDCEETVRSVLDNLHATGDVRGVELELVTILGGRIPVLLTGSNVFDHSGTELYHQIILQDITQIKKGEEEIRKSEERFRAVAESAVDAIITIDGSGIIIGWNHAAERMFGYDEREISGRTLDQVIPDRYLAAHRHGMQKLQSDDKAHIIGKTIEMEGKRKNGSEFPLELSLAEWRAGKEWFYTGIIRDVTERRQAETALQKKMNELQRFHALTVGRELTMIELKKEINALLVKTGQPEKYKIVD